MKINANLNQFEAEALFDILEKEIIKNKIDSKLRFLSKEISKSELDWYQGHAIFLEKIKNKLIK